MAGSRGINNNYSTCAKKGSQGSIFFSMISAVVHGKVAVPVVTMALMVDVSVAVGVMVVVTVIGGLDVSPIVAVASVVMILATVVVVVVVVVPVAVDLGAVADVLGVVGRIVPVVRHAILVHVVFVSRVLWFRGRCGSRGRFSNWGLGFLGGSAI